MFAGLCAPVCVACSCHTLTGTVLVVIFKMNPGLASCPLDPGSLWTYTLTESWVEGTLIQLCRL